MFSVRYTLLRVDDILGRVIRNPNYGGPSVGPFGWTWRPEISKAAKPEFHRALSESVKKEGIRNPILVWSFNEGIYLTFGGSRVRAAKSAGLERVPCIVNDYTGDFAECPEVTPDNWQSFFKDVPRDAEFNEQGFDYHYNLERARRANHDPNGFAWVDGEPNFIKTEFPWLFDQK